MALQTTRLKGSLTRRCSSHRMESCVKHKYICNKMNHHCISKDAKILLSQGNLIVFTNNDQRDRFEVIIDKKSKRNMHSIPMGPFCIGEGRFIHEIHSCSLNSTKDYLIVSASVSSVERTIKYLSSYIVIFCVKTRTVFKKSVVDADMPYSAVFHSTQPNNYFTISYDEDEDTNILKSCYLENGNQRYTYLTMIDMECENLVTLNASEDYLILQVLQADVTPPYFLNKTYVLSSKTLKVLHKLEELICAPCHTSCTFNYIPDLTIFDGHIAINFPYVEKSDISITPISNTSKTLFSNAPDNRKEFLEVARIPTTLVPSLKFSVKMLLRQNVTCNTCIDTLPIPNKLKHYLCNRE